MVDVYGTLGPSCSSEEILTQMFLAGMTGIRLNLSHISLHESAGQVEILRAAAKNAGVVPRLLVDMQGPELRIGRLKAPLMLGEDDTAALYSEDLPEEERILIRRAGITAVPIPAAIWRELQIGTEILFDDGRILLKVSDIGQRFTLVKVIRGGMLAGRKSIKVPELSIHMPTMTAADLDNIREAAAFGVTGIMQPFVRSRKDLEEVRRALEENGAGHLQLIAKIENREGMRRLESLLPACDGICIARGDLGNDMELWELPQAQKQIAAACRKAGRYFFVATQMLSSMEKCAVPTRAEVNDIFNTVADGAGGVMVTGETAIGKYPVEAVHFLAQTARSGERYREQLTAQVLPDTGTFEEAFADAGT